MPKHVEAQFCHLEYTKAGLISAMVDLDEGLPVVFILKHGKVTHALPPARLDWLLKTFDGTLERPARSYAA